VTEIKVKNKQNFDKVNKDIENQVEESERRCNLFAANQAKGVK